MLVLTVQTFSSAEGLWLIANLVSQVHPWPMILLLWNPQEGWLGAGRSWHLRVSPPTSRTPWLLQQLVVSTRTCPPEQACIPLDPLLRWFCSIWPWPSCWPRGLYLATRREWLPIAALSHLTEDAVTCESTTPLPRLSYLEVLALPFDSRLELSLHPRRTGCTSWFGNSQEENTSVNVLTRTKLSVIHYTF